MGGAAGSRGRKRRKGFFFLYNINVTVGDDPVGSLV